MVVGQIIFFAADRLKPPMFGQSTMQFVKLQMFNLLPIATLQ
jgi:hypothetical protein